MAAPAKPTATKVGTNAHAEPVGPPAAAASKAEANGHTEAVATEVTTATAARPAKGAGNGQAVAGAAAGARAAKTSTTSHADVAAAVAARQAARRSANPAARAGMNFGLPAIKLPSLLPKKQVQTLEDLLRRDEADLLLVAGNLALVALEIIEWPVAAMALAIHFLAKTRFKALEVIAEVAEEAT
jgi:hypothetical protein